MLQSMGHKELDTTGQLNNNMGKRTKKAHRTPGKPVLKRRQKKRITDLEKFKNIFWVGSKLNNEEALRKKRPTDSNAP